MIGRVTSRDLLGKRLEAANAEGGSLLIDATKGIMVDEAKVIKADIIADNGFIHVIDTVVTPK
ncbi:Fasciclin domain protein [compost metagenome]